MVTVTAAEFNRAPSKVKYHAVETGEPVFVTDRSRPSLVVMKYDAYLRLTDAAPITNLADWLQMDEEIDFDPEPLSLELAAVDL